MSYTGPHSQQDQTVLSDTLNEWREKTNQHADILNAVKMYDVVHGDGITYSRTGGSVTLEVAPNITKGLTIGGDLVVAGNITFTGTAASFDMTTVTIDDHQIELGASGANNAAGADDAGVDDGGIVVLSTSATNKKWTWRNSFNGHQAWVSNQHIGISAGKAFVGEDDVIRFENTEANGLHVEFKNDGSGNPSPVADLSFATGVTAGMFGNNTGTGGIRFRQDGAVEILRGVNRKIIDKTSHGFVHGDVVRWTGTDWVKAQANGEIGAEIFGVVDRYSSNNSHQFVVVTHGEIQGFSGGGAGGNNEGMELTSGEIHFLDPDVAGAMTISRPYAKGSIVKPVLFGLSETTGFVLNYIGGIVPDQDIIANSVPQTWRIVADGSADTYGLSGSASTIAGSHIVSINGVMQVPENDGGTYGAGTGITFGTGGGTGPASFRIVAGTGTATVGNRIQFIEPPVAGAEIVVMNHALTKPFEAIKETNLKSTGATEPRNILDRLGDYVSVKDYGALGDGTTDDTIPIQRAINQTETNANKNKRKIFFPTGVYVISSPLKINRHNLFLCGEGSLNGGDPDSEQSTIQIANGHTGPALCFEYAGLTGDLLDFCGGFKMEDIAVFAPYGTTGSDGNPCPIIDMTGCWGSHLNRIMTVGASGLTSSCGVRLHGWYSNSITNSRIGNWSVNGIEVHGWNDSLLDVGFSAGYTRATHNIQISGNMLGNESPNAPDHGIKIEGGTFGVHNVSIEDNVFSNSQYGMSVAGSNENIIIKNNKYCLRAAADGAPASYCASGITSDGLTRNLIEFGNSGAQYGNTGAAFTSNSGFQNHVSINNGSVQGVNIPKVVALFAGSNGALIGGTGSGATGTNYNVEKVTRNGTGDYTIDFTTDLQTDNYSIQGFIGGTAGFVYGTNRATDQSESLMRIYSHHVTYGLCDPEYISVTII
jgi:parallel beta-helix repeat protein